MKIEQDHPNGTDARPNSPPRFADKLPVVPARVNALKASYRQSWLYFLLIICLLVAWWIPVRFAVTRWLMFRPGDSGPRDAHEFVALAYAGISKNHDEVTPERFRAQLAALRAAGYHSVTLDDIAALYRKNTPLPRKAVLLTFDHSRESSYFDARRTLRRAGWHAVMFLWTKPILEEDPSALRWPYVQAMLRSGAWEAGAQSHNGFDLVLADNDGHRRNFMTTPRWNPDAMRYETPEAFRQRLVDDHELCRQVIADKIGHNPRAYAFPYGDFGQYDERAVFTRRLNLDLLSRYYELGFTHGNVALNTRHSDPRRLNRLLVRAEWTADDLLQRLEHAWPKTDGYAGREVLNSYLAWLTDWGGFELRDGVAVLTALPDTTGAKVWLNGSDLYVDFHAHLHARIAAGQFGMFLRASPDGESYIYLGMGRDGDVWLRQKHIGMQPFTLTSGRYTVDDDTGFDLDVYLRDRLFYAAVNGRPIFQEIATVRGDVAPGMVGYSVWHPRRGCASAEITALDLKPFSPALITMKPVGGRDPALAYWLSRNAFRYTHFSPPWLRVFARGQSEQFGWDLPFLNTIARIHRMRFVPEIVLESLDGYDSDLSERLAASAAALPARGVLCNLTQMEGTLPLARVTAWMRTFSQALATRDLELIVRLPPVWEQAPAMATLFQGLTNLTVAVDAGSPLLGQARDTGLDRLMAAHTIALDPRAVRPFVYELTGADSMETNVTPEVHATLLRESGYAALRAGAFDRALEIWGQWGKMAPRNAEPFALMGDVYMQRDETVPAVDAYCRSLELNPGQIALVSRCVRLMYIHAGRDAEAREMLDLYERLFPDNTDIILARAEWLIYHQRAEEATALINRIIERNPKDLDARGLLHRLLPTPLDRFDNIQSMLEIGATPGMAQHMAQTARRWDMLLWPESWRMMAFFEGLAAGGGTNVAREIYDGLLPRETVVREEFNAGHMSENWIMAADGVVEGEESFFGAKPTQTEVVLRLAGSDTMHGGFIEASLDDARGFFWLYARRSGNSMIRFGFEQAGNIYLQIWRDGHMLANQTRVWTKPSGTVTMRLEVRGDGAFGLVNGQAAFGAPTPIPRDIGLGWWGLAPWSQKFGTAQALLREVAGGPLPVKLAVFKHREMPWTDTEYLNALRPWTRDLSVVAPVWFAQEADGGIRREFQNDYRDLRILCRYYQIRLQPCIRAVSYQTLNLQALIDLAREWNLQGFTLLLDRMPDTAWFERIERELFESGLSLIAMRLNEKNQVAELRELSPFIGLFSGGRIVRRLPVVAATEDAAGADDAKPAPALNGADEKMCSAVLLF